MMHINPIHLVIAVGTGIVAGYLYRRKGKVNFKIVAVLCVGIALVVAFADWMLL